MLQLYRIPTRLFQSLAGLMQQRPLTFTDVGASGGIGRRWKLADPLVYTVGFEPNPVEYQKLVKAGSANCLWLPYALHKSNGDFPLYLTRYPANISMLKPNMPVMSFFSYDLAGLEVLEETIVPCRTLDTIAGEYQLQIDAIKLDTQGTELYILAGGRQVLADQAFCVQTEVEFCEMYVGQPLFCDVHARLSSEGFLLMDIGDVLYLKTRNSRSSGGHKGILFSADGLYFRRIERVVEQIRQDGSLRRLGSAVLICLVYGYPDYAIELVLACVQAQLISASEVETLLLDLSHIQHWSRHIPGIKKRDVVARFFQELSDLFRQPRNAEWMYDLGNRNVFMYPWTWPRWKK